MARTVTDVLRGVVTGGTGHPGPTSARPVAGKTGTTQNSADAWFVGYTPQLSTAVWMGAARGTACRWRTSAGGPGVTGGSFPAAIWRAFMAPAHDGLPVVDFDDPPAGGAGQVPGRRPGRPSAAAAEPPSTDPPVDAHDAAPPPAPTPAPAPAPATPAPRTGGGGRGAGGNGGGGGGGGPGYRGG